MRKGCFFVIGTFLLLLGACGDGGTVDPNAFAEGLSSGDDLPEVNVPSSSSRSKATEQPSSSPNPTVDVHVSSSSQEDVDVVPIEMSSMREDKGYSSSESINPTLDLDSSVSGDVYVHKYFNFNANNASNYIAPPKNNRADSTYAVNTSVYEEEKGAVSYCADDDKSYTLRFRILAEKEVKKLLILKELGPVCEDISKKFKDACESKNGAELQMVSACDSKGNLEMFCSYTDLSANFVTLLADFTNEVETNCNSEYLDASVYLQNQW
jgi:hypothetical protein